jgi:hypothetical protein
MWHCHGYDKDCTFWQMNRNFGERVETTTGNAIGLLKICCKWQGKKRTTMLDGELLYEVEFMKRSVDSKANSVFYMFLDYPTTSIKNEYF